MGDLKLITYGKLSNEFAKIAKVKFPDVEVFVPENTQELIEQIPFYHIYAGFNYLSGIEVTHLKWIHSFGAGVDSFLRNESILKNKIPISRTKGNLGKKIGEYCLGHILNLFQNITQFKSAQKNEIWKPTIAKNLFEANLLILGTGNIGAQIAKIFEGLVYSITGINNSGKSLSPFQKIIRFDEISINDYDIIINTLPLTPVTTNLLGLDFFSHFRNGIFINVGRGNSVIEEDLLKAIQKNYLKYAVLDVFESEPLSSNSPFWNHSKITVTPHVSGLTTVDDVVSSFAEALRQFQKGSTGELFVNHTKGY